MPLPAPVPAPKPPPQLSELTLSPDTFMPARRGPALLHRGRTGAALRFRLSRAAPVRFEVIRGVRTPEDLAPEIGRGPSGFAPLSAAGGRRLASGRTVSPERTVSGGRFAVHGRRGLNRLRFSGRLRGRPLATGEYVLRAVVVDRAGRTSAPQALRFRIGHEQD